jgi:DNA methylase
MDHRVIDDVKVLDQEHGDDWTVYNADCIDVMSGMPDNSVHFQISSPPFESLYVFSDNPRDVSNNNSKEVFFEHYGHVIRHQARICMPGRIIATHCMQLPTSKTRDGFIGMRDFRGEIIRAFQAEGMIFHSEVMIRKDPVSAMQRSKAIGLLHKQVCKDSAMSRMAAADYMVMMRKPGDNPEPIGGPFDAYYGDEAPSEGPLWNENSEGREALRPGDPWFSVATWQRYAESVWTDINQSDVLSFRCAREEEDERHISPLQLTPIRRCIDLWSNPSDIVFSPFAGIGSELYCAVEMGRKAIGAELKESYFRQAVANLKSIKNVQASLFDVAAE